MLGSNDLAATTLTLVYTVPALKQAAITVSMCSRSGTAAIRLAVSNGGAPTDGQYLEYGATLDAGEVLERSGIALQAGDRVYAYASAAGVSVNVYGIEEIA